MRLRRQNVIHLAALSSTLVLVCTSMLADDQSTAPRSTPLVIAHRGASGYLPEHTEGAKVLAFAQGADVIEQDVVLSRDGVFVVSHDITMDHTTNARELFPGRERDDGKLYYADFDWSELKTLSLHERNLDTPGGSRFPFRINSRPMSLEDEIRLIRGLNQTLHKKVGFHIELKAPAWHQEEFGQHMGHLLLTVLRKAGVDPQSTPCFIQCFEPDELIYLRQETECPFPLIQLLGGRPLGLVAPAPEADRLQQFKNELKEIAKYADGIGPAIPLLFSPTEETSGVTPVKSSGLVEAAHVLGLLVHPYTVRADSLPKWCRSTDQLHFWLVQELKVDGFFTDFPDLGRKAVDLQNN